MATADFGFPGQRDRLVRTGPIALVHVGVGRDFVASSRARQHLALVDTGALDNCIDLDFARGIGLNPSEYVTGAGVGGLYETEMYAAHVYIPDLDHLVVGNFMGARLLAGGLPHAILLGRAFLRHFTMTYDGRSGSAILATPPSS